MHLSHALWGARFSEGEEPVHPCAATSVHSYFATRDYNSGNFAGALQHFDRAFAAAMASGQVVTAVVVAVNTGSAYGVLNDHEAALEWLQRGLDLARPNGWAPVCARWAKFFGSWAGWMRRNRC